MRRSAQLDLRLCFPKAEADAIQTKPGLFKFANFRQWVVVPSGPELIEDVRKATDDVLSIREPLRDFLQTDYTLEYVDLRNTYHRDVIRSKLTRNIAPIFDQVHDELLGAMGDFIPTVGEEWAKVSVLPFMQRLSCRISSRVFVGAPLCRNTDYHKLVSDTSVNLMKSAHMIAMVPRPLKAIVAQIVSKIPFYTRQTMEFLRPLVEERFAKMEKLGEKWDDAPHDVLMWLMNEAKEEERSLEGLTKRMLLVNFASLHSTCLTLTQVFYRLVDNPDYVGPLRREVEAVVAEEGWTKAGIDKMHKIDSFIRETQRLDVQGILGVFRLALRPFTFSNGMTIPAGTLVALPQRALHTDEDIYSDPDQFDGFRFARLREQEGDVMVATHQTVSTSSDHVAFGIGRHQCPGRFLAAVEIKALLAHIVVTYDVKFEEGKGLPVERHMGPFRYPGNADVLFRKRQR